MEETVWDLRQLVAIRKRETKSSWWWRVGKKRVMFVAGWRGANSRTLLRVGNQLSVALQESP